MSQRPEPKTASSSSARPAFASPVPAQTEGCPDCGYRGTVLACIYKDCPVLRPKPLGQRRSHSALEAVVNVLVGFGLSVGANQVLISWLGYPIRLDQSLGLGLIFTVLSLVRSYTLRRLFNHFQ